MNTGNIDLLRKTLQKVYFNRKDILPFHGWHHITFIVKKSLLFGEKINADLFIVESAALVHDLNYIVKPNSTVYDGLALRQEYLRKAEYSPEVIERIEKIVQESASANRSKKISIEGMALSDADSLFKVLPLTPVIFASKYISENKIDIYKLTEKITSEQNSLLAKDIYFYTDFAKKNYLSWAKLNLELWNQIHDAFDDKDVNEMLSIAHELGVL